MIELFVISPWAVETVGGIETREPRITQKYACAYEDVSATPAEHVPPTVNALVARVVCDASTADQIAADAELRVLSRIDLDAGETHQGKLLAKSEKEAASAFLTSAGASKAAVDAALQVDAAADAKTVVDATAAFCRALTKQST